jgi:hypothetical protein
MSRGDQLVDQAADRLQELADHAAAEDGLMAKLAEPLAQDAAFLRQLKPSLIKARIRGEAPTGLPPRQGAVAPSGPQVGARPKGDGGPNPFLVMGIAFVAGIALAKLIDWRGHAHPRD